MKRAGKCVGKATYKHKNVAMQSAAKWYKSEGRQLGIYECPTCLDFHLTSKYCNLKHKHRKWLFALARELRKEEIIFDNKWFVSPEVKEKRRQKRLRKKQNKLAKQKLLDNLFLPPKEKKALTQEEMKAIFRSFDGKIYPQRKSFWNRIHGIIIGKGAAFGTLPFIR